MKNQVLFMALVVFFIIYCGLLNAQQVDTTHATRIRELEMQIDSLCNIVQSTDEELRQIKQNMVEEKSEVDALIALFNNEDVESISMESRSRKQRVDALLKAITQRPGQLRFNGGATTILQNGSDDKNRHTTAVGSFDIYAHTSFSPHTLLFIDLEAIGGNGPNEFFQTLTGMNGDAGSTQAEDGIDRLTVLEAWAEFTMLNNRITVTAGKIDLTNYFDNNASANDETMQFISDAFVNSAAFAVPDNSPGLRFQTTLWNRFHLQLGFSSANNVNSDLGKDIYKIAGLGLSLFPGSGFESNFRFYGYQHPLAANAIGWGISFDKVAFGAYNIFARYGQNEAKVAEYWGIQSSWSMGTRFVKQIAGQTTALGFAYGENSSELNMDKKEKVIEIYTRRKLNNWMHLSPHLQIVRNAGGASKRLLILGVRTQFIF